MAIDGKCPDPPAAGAIDCSLEASRKEGSVAQVALTILDYYVIPFALFLGASSREIGLLTALPNLLASFSQFFVVDVLRAAGNRRRLLIWSVAAQSFALAPMCALPFIDGVKSIDLLLACLSLFRVVGAVMGPPWGSLMSDYLPENKRGDYFGRRSQLVGVSGMLVAVVCGCMLSAIHARKAGAIPFFLLFAAATFCRGWSTRYMAAMTDMPLHPQAPPRPAEDGRSFWRRLHESNFARFVAYAAAITFAAQMTAAYLSVHMLRDLHYSYFWYTAVQLSSAVASFLTFPIWGRHADHVGNARVLRLNSVLLPVIPLLWCMTEAPWGLALIEAFGGFVWAGFNLCSTNFIYEAVPPEQRVRALGYFNLLNGAAIFCGATLGGYLADALPPVWGYSIHTLFLIAAGVRFAADFLLAYHFREVRPTAKRVTGEALFFSVIGVRPLIGHNVDLEFDAPARLSRHGEPRVGPLAPRA